MLMNWKHQYVILFIVRHIFVWIYTVRGKNKVFKLVFWSYLVYLFWLHVWIVIQIGKKRYVNLCNYMKETRSFHHGCFCTRYYLIKGKNFNRFSLFALLSTLRTLPNGNCWLLWKLLILYGKRDTILWSHLKHMIHKMHRSIHKAMQYDKKTHFFIIQHVY